MSYEREDMMSQLKEGKALLVDDCDDAIVGVASDLHTSCVRAVYSRALLVKSFMRQNPEWTEDDAEEWVSYNVEGAYLGPSTPIIAWMPDLSEELGKAAEDEQGNDTPKP